ncbi:Basic leucine zipper 10 [Hibiscus syriacus]|uniref:Basic leucine zipper 10 n=1 Tax=Hibiscus syriacus TaxID=106335 RepID=A0A6A2YQX8_HIBSY|nr:Basic leucine zipper 10 [Hibiscus syriacus]
MLGNFMALRSSKAEGQGEADVTPCGVLVESTTHKKSGMQVRQATSGSSIEDSDSDELEGDAETTDNMDAADAKRKRSELMMDQNAVNRESARRSRRRKQVQMNELEGQVGQLRVEHSTLLKSLTDMNHNYDAAAVDNRIMKADIETLRAKTQLLSVGMPFLRGPLEASTVAPLPLRSNANQFFHPVPSIVAPMHHHWVDNGFVGSTLVPPDMTSNTKGVKNVNETSTSQLRPSSDGIQDQIDPGVHALGPMHGWELGHAADRNHKLS